LQRLIAGKALLAEPVDPIVGGLTCHSWLDLYQACHEPNGMGGMTRVEWPDGGSLADQPACVVVVFSIIGQLVAAESARQQRQKG
jgi:hypothetical protein